MHAEHSHCSPCPVCTNVRTSVHAHTPHTRAGACDICTQQIQCALITGHCSQPLTGTHHKRGKVHQWNLEEYEKCMVILGELQVPSLLSSQEGRTNGQSSGCFTAPPSPWLTNRLRPLTEWKQHMNHYRHLSHPARTPSTHRCGTSAARYLGTKAAFSPLLTICPRVV